MCHAQTENGAHVGGEEDLLDMVLHFCALGAVYLENLLENHVEIDLYNAISLGNQPDLPAFLEFSRSWIIAVVSFGPRREANFAARTSMAFCVGIRTNSVCMDV